MIENIREENGYLLRHYNQLDEKCKKLQKELNDVRKSNDKYYNSYKEQSEELTNAIIKIDDLSKIKQVL